MVLDEKVLKMHSLQFDLQNLVHQRQHHGQQAWAPMITTDAGRGAKAIQNQVGQFAVKQQQHQQHQQQTQQQQQQQIQTETFAFEWLHILFLLELKQGPSQCYISASRKKHNLQCEISKVTVMIQEQLGKFYK